MINCFYNHIRVLELEKERAERIEELSHATKRLTELNEELQSLKTVELELRTEYEKLKAEVSHSSHLETCNKRVFARLQSQFYFERPCLL